MNSKIYYSISLCKRIRKYYCMFVTSVSRFLQYTMTAYSLSQEGTDIFSKSFPQSISAILFWYFGQRKLFRLPTYNCWCPTVACVEKLRHRFNFGPLMFEGGCGCLCLVHSLCLCNRRTEKARIS